MAGGLGKIVRGEVTPEIAHGCGLYKIDGAAAKPSAGHTRANQSRLGLGNFHHQIEFLATDLIIVTEAAMRIAHQRPESFAISLVKCLDRASHAQVFCDDMVASCKNLWGKIPGMFFQLRKRDVAKCANLRERFPQASNALFGLRAPGVVLAASQLVVYT